MIELVRVRASCAFLVVALFVAPLSLADDPGDAAGVANVQVSFRLGQLDGGKRVPVKTYDLVVAVGSPGSRLLAGSRVPFPSASDPEDDSMTGFVYQNIGFTTQVEAHLVGKKQIRLIANIEDSRISDAGEGQPPSVETRQLAVNAILTDGVPLELTRVEGVTDQAGFVEVEAKILH